MTAIELIERILLTSTYGKAVSSEAGCRLNDQIEASANEETYRINAMAATDCMIAITKMNCFGELSANEILAQIVDIMDIAAKCKAEMSEK